MNQMHYRPTSLLALIWITAVSFAGPIHANWPQWRGPTGTGEWNPDSFPGKLEEDDVKILWKQRINGGYAGVTADADRVFTMDYAKSPTEQERILCFQADTGTLLWEHAYEVRYDSLDYGSGPRASVTIDGDFAYTLGAVGHAFCLEVSTGSVVWDIDTVAALRAQAPTWGFAASPAIWNDLAILHVGAQPGGSYIALDKKTGKEVWRSSNDPAGYCTPFHVEREGIEQFIGWTPEHIHGISPTDGKVQWSIPYKVKYGVSIASPIFADGIALVSGYWHGTRAIQLDSKLETAKLLWSDEKNLCGLMSQPLHKDGYIYLLDKANGLICFELATGRILWKDAHQTTPADRNPQASIVWADKANDLICALNANGELIVANCTPEGFTERSRMQLIGKTWAHPAFLKNRIYARSDREIVAVQLWQ